jgi:hypothetical protein
MCWTDYRTTARSAVSTPGSQVAALALTDQEHLLEVGSHRGYSWIDDIITSSHPLQHTTSGTWTVWLSLPGSTWTCCAYTPSPRCESPETQIVRATAFLQQHLCGCYLLLQPHLAMLQVFATCGKLKSSFGIACTDTICPIAFGAGPAARLQRAGHHPAR